MILDKFSYSENINTPNKWKINEFRLNDINLMVGSNSSGKTRTLNVISTLSHLLLSPRAILRNGHYKTSFDAGDDKYSYEIKINDGIIEKEILLFNDKSYISRAKDGKGKIYSSESENDIKFKIPTNELIAYRRDELQYPYLEHLFDWADKLRHFKFAKKQEKHSLEVVDINKPKQKTFNFKETDKPIEIFKTGKNKFPQIFQKSIISDFNAIGYTIKEIDIKPMQSVQIDSSVKSSIVGLNVKEADRSGYTDQNTMSDGMFRALSIIIYFNYYQLAGLKGTVLIDDIGEGLDFERSTKLIKLLIDKALKTDIQLIMSTNDKFVMNNTNLDYWQVIHREGDQVSMHNRSNSKEIFEDFRFTGLNNFDFYTTDFFKTGLQ